MYLCVIVSFGCWWLFCSLLTDIDVMLDVWCVCVLVVLVACCFERWCSLLLLCVIRYVCCVWPLMRIGAMFLVVVLFVWTMLLMNVYWYLRMCVMFDVSCLLCKCIVLCCLCVWLLLIIYELSTSFLLIMTYCRVVWRIFLLWVSWCCVIVWLLFVLFATSVSCY